jgi:hypothetical protein
MLGTGWGYRVIGLPTRWGTVVCDAGCRHRTPESNRAKSDQELTWCEIESRSVKRCKRLIVCGPGRIDLATNPKTRNVIQRLLDLSVLLDQIALDRAAVTAFNIKVDDQLTHIRAFPLRDSRHDPLDVPRRQRQHHRVGSHALDTVSTRWTCAATSGGTTLPAP